MPAELRQELRTKVATAATSLSSSKYRNSSIGCLHLGSRGGPGVVGLKRMAFIIEAGFSD